MNSENNTKQMLIEAAYNMILEKGAENIRVRIWQKESDVRQPPCTSTLKAWTIYWPWHL